MGTDSASAFYGSREQMTGPRTGKQKRHGGEIQVACGKRSIMVGMICRDGRTEGDKEISTLS